MTTITIETENTAVAKKLVGFLKTISSIRSVTIHSATENPFTAADWVSAGKPATDEDHELMLKEAEKSPSMTARAAERFSKELIEKWSRKK